MDAQQLEQLITDYGIKNAGALLAAAHKPGRPTLPRCLALTENESFGRNEYGDEGLAAPWLREQPVTQANYTIYKQHREELYAQGITDGVDNGVGPTQLTTRDLQLEAQQLGGCWIPEYNFDVGFHHLHELITELGVREGFRAYNGSGPDAEAYAARAIEREGIWKWRLGQIR